MARLREEVIRLRRMVSANQSEQVLRSRQERMAIDENARLRKLLEAEVHRTRALTRALSDSESSLEIEDERLVRIIVIQSVLPKDLKRSQS